mgnify:CR=1 FL=1
MIIEEDFFTLNQYDSKNNDTNEEEAIIRNVLTPCIKRMDSSNSIKPNDLYYIKSSSKFSENYVNENVFNNSNSNCLMSDDFDSQYDNTFNQDNNFVEKPNNNFSSFSGKIMVNHFATVINDNDTIILNIPDIKKGKLEEEIKEVEIKEEVIKEGVTSIGIKIDEKPMKKKSKRGKRGPYKKKPKLVTETDTNDERNRYRAGHVNIVTTNVAQTKAGKHHG